ncbi:MAG: hypothetical protein HC844_02585 [Tabrizicola sp.]|nr:hypothetical protein [Tabrizicola sp.]
MRHQNLFLTAAVLAFTSGSAAFSQSTTETVDLTLDIAQPSLFDSDLKDTFKGSVDDRSGLTTLEVTCSAGASAWLGLSRIDEACAVNGNGSIKNPNNPAQSLPRVSYSGASRSKPSRTAIPTPPPFWPTTCAQAARAPRTARSRAIW